jgi:hypothetical protein
MNLFHFLGGQKNIPCKILLLIDWENLFYSLCDILGPIDMQLEQRIKKMMEWISVEVGEVFAGFVFAPEHMNSIHQRICTELGFTFIVCPKKYLTVSQLNPKTGFMINILDTVDQGIIDFGTMMTGYSEFNTVCLVSGDSDFIPFLKLLKKHKKRIALVAPTTYSLSQDKQMENLADLSPKTGNIMFLKLVK